jgi:flagellar biosynthesis/type III secretory pathway protein FliH
LANRDELTRQLQADREKHARELETARLEGVREGRREGHREAINAMMDVLASTWVNCLENAFIE